MKNNPAKDLVRYALMRVGMGMAALFGHRSMILDMRVVDSTTHSGGDANADACWGRLTEALSLIQLHDRRSYDRMVNDVRFIFLLAAGGPEFLPVPRAILLNKAYIMRRDAQRLAMDLVHEAFHARLRSLRVRHNEQRAARIEALCVHSEIKLAIQMTGNNDLGEEAARVLQTNYWEEGPMRKRREAELAALKAWPITVKVWRWLNR